MEHRLGTVLYVDNINDVSFQEVPSGPISTCWRKSLKSAYNGSCVEVASAGNRILVRDSKDSSGLILQFSCAAWSDFLGRVEHRKYIES